MSFNTLFENKLSVIGVIHLPALPGAPGYDGDMSRIYDQAIEEADILTQNDVDGLIVENFNDVPFYPGRVPVETVAAMSCIVREVAEDTSVPVGVNVLRNDGLAAMAIAASSLANFVRVNVHMGAVVSEQGIMQGCSQDVMRLREHLKAQNVLVLTDAAVKHAAPLAGRGLAEEVKDLDKRGLADGIIISGIRTGEATRPEDLQAAREATGKPLIVGSGATAGNLATLAPHADALIVGSTFKKDGRAENALEDSRVRAFMDDVMALREKVAA